MSSEALDRFHAASLSGYLTERKVGTSERIILYWVCREAHAVGFQAKGFKADGFLFEGGREFLSRVSGIGVPAVARLMKKLFSKEILILVRGETAHALNQVLRINLPEVPNGLTKVRALPEARSKESSPTVEESFNDGLRNLPSRSNEPLTQHRDINTKDREEDSLLREVLDRIARAARLQGVGYHKRAAEALRSLLERHTVEDLERRAKERTWKDGAQLIAVLEEWTYEEEEPLKPSKPEWCGTCDSETRRIEGEKPDGTPYSNRCPKCHPLEQSA